MNALATLRRMHTTRGWIAFGVVAFFGLVLIPILHGALPPTSPLAVSDRVIALLGKFSCYALTAVALDLIWGFTGMLSLGHGVFFALGGYAMGMYLMLGIGKEGVYRSNLPDFMVFLDWKELPWFWHGFQNFYFAVFAALWVPGLLAYVFGYFAFRSRIRGVYFSIITQALTYALMLLFFRNDTGLGGNNGLTDFKQIYGWPLALAGTKRMLYIATVAALCISYLLCRYIVTGKAGRVLRAVRDSESRVMFLGYDPRKYKLFAWTFSAVLCGLAGALYVPQVGIINPSELQPSNSIEMAIWAAVGGRGTLVGAALGAFVVNGAKSWFTVALPELWLFVLGALFIVVTLFLPDGVVGAAVKLLEKRAPKPAAAAEKSA
ncbi:MAG TPA: urea ABC transporter permease subunit UrtC [Polyangiaceae bacterium]|nr:urea ABC transporter permease subunit UrtC [Polyangiaceae bacterium]